MKRSGFSIFQVILWQVLLGGCLCVLLVEFALRTEKQEIFAPPNRYDVNVGWTGTPNFQYIADFDSSEVVAQSVQFDSGGFRTGPHEATTTSKKIAVLGDSIAVGVQVEYQKTFPSLLEKNLNRRSPSNKSFVRNFGVSDFGTYQELQVLNSDVKQWHPQIVIFVVFAYNDILNNTEAAYGLSSPQDLYRPYFHDGLLVERDAQLRAIPRFFRRHLKLYRMLEQRVFQTIYPIFGWRAPGTQEWWQANLERTASELPFRGGFEPLWPVFFSCFLPPAQQPYFAKQGWIATEKLFGHIISDIKEIGAKPVVIVIPHEHELKAHVADYPRRLGYVPDRFYAERRIAKFFELQHVATVRMIARFDKAKTKVVPYWSGHLNEAAHAIVAEELAKSVEGL